MREKNEIDRFESKYMPEPNSGCWLWFHAWASKGHGIFHIVETNKNVRAHRFAWELYVGPIPDGMWVLHRCDIPCCVNPDHLFLGTHQDNVDDCVRKRRHTFGSKNPMAILTDEIVIAMLIDPREPGIVADEFGVGRTHLTAIRAGRAWKHLSHIPRARPLIAGRMR